MSEFILILVWIGLMYTLVHSRQSMIEEWVDEKVQYRTTRVIALIVFVPIILMAGNRGTSFGDTYSYIAKFNSMPSSFSELGSYIALSKKDTGFYAFSAVIKCLITQNSSTYLLILAGIQGILLLSFFRKYSDNYLMSVFLFVASADYLSWMYNGIRQFMAVTIILSATGLMLRKKLFLTIAVIIVASTFHQSALLMIPFVIIAQGKVWNKKTVLFLAVAIITVTSVSEFTSFMDRVLETTQYTNVVSDYIAMEDDGTNPFRVLVYCLPAILSFFERKQIENENSSLLNFAANMSIIAAAIYIVSMFTSGIFIGRLPIYASLFNYVLLPWEISNINSVFSISTKFARNMMIFGYLAFYYYQIVIAWGLI